MDKFFKITQRGSNFKTESIGGVTTFLAMSYILFVNPLILSDAGMPADAVFTATALAAALGTLIMAVLANYPVALAPGMGMNAFFTYSVVIGLGFSWQEALAGIFVSGVLFIIISATGLREIIINAIPISLKYAVGTGIGFFIAFIGLQQSGIIVDNPATLVGVGDFTNLATLFTVIGLFITVVLYVRGVKAAIFIGLVVTAFLGLVSGVTVLPEGFGLTSIVAAPPSLMPTFGALFKPLFSASTYSWNFLIVILTFLFVDFFDTAGTLIAVGTRAGLIDKEGKLNNGSKALLADSIATVTGSILGTSSVTSYTESLTGVEVGAKTGFASLVSSGLFLLSLFFAPLLFVVTPYATAPALIMVGALMVSSFAHIDWEDIAITIPSFITVIFMVLTYSIATGLAAGFIIYTVLMIATNRTKEVHPVMYVLSVLFLFYFISI